MNKYQIGSNAGVAWNVLKDNAHWDYDKLKEATGLHDRDLNAALGWLAREDKIEFETKGTHDSVYITVNVYIG